MVTNYGHNARQELEDNAPDYEDILDDEQNKYDHTTCGDTRSRFYVTNKGGAYLYHCFNCNESGYYRPKDRYSPTPSLGRNGMR